MTGGDLAARARLDAAFAREERRGLMVAAVARSAAVVIILGWLAVSNPEGDRRSRGFSAPRPSSS